MCVCENAFLYMRYPFSFSTLKDKVNSSRDMATKEEEEETTSAEEGEEAESEEIRMQDQIIIHSIKDISINSRSQEDILTTISKRYEKLLHICIYIHLSCSIIPA